MATVDQARGDGPDVRQEGRRGPGRCCNGHAEAKEVMIIAAEEPDGQAKVAITDGAPAGLLAAPRVLRP